MTNDASIYNIETFDTVPDEAGAVVDTGLGEFNDQAAPLHEVQRLACFIRNADNRIVGGAIGRRWLHCCELQQLWVAPDARTQGVGARLMQEFERHARSRGCASIQLETYSFQAPAFYLRLGYAVEFARRDFPHDIVKFHMSKPLSDQDGVPARPGTASDLLAYRCLSPDSDTDIEALHTLFQKAADYSLLVEGKLPTREEARDELTELPAGMALTNKFFLGFWRAGELIGCADLLRGYPEPWIAYIGLLLFAPDHRGRGLGVTALHQLGELARAWQCRELRLAVIDTNTQALRFWTREGFQELYRKPVDGFTGDAIVLHKTPI